MLRNLLTRLDAALEAERTETNRAAARHAELIVMRGDVAKLAKMAGAA